MARVRGFLDCYAIALSQRNCCLVYDLPRIHYSGSKKSKSPAELVRELVDYGFSLSSAFAEEIYARAPRKTAGVNEAEAAMLLRKQNTFSLLEADLDEDEGNMEKQSASESRKSDKRQKRFRKKIGESEDDDDEAYCFL
ncbi:unnamed protein product [Arabis nemorensis]|uniref:Uncharacterized protein n=1 Tax=Arabis nemorensis TaxID=586526 RepID=A0A565BLH7_9BRAS|nr:unnamed protein product [Arabis nemorensis]